MEGFLRLQYGDDGLSQAVFNVGESGVADDLEETLEAKTTWRRWVNKDLPLRPCRAAWVS